MKANSKVLEGYAHLDAKRVLGVLLQRPEDLLDSVQLCDFDLSSGFRVEGLGFKVQGFAFA
jgi:hypothetical protein